jgi:hypothetical protein
MKPFFYLLLIFLGACSQDMFKRYESLGSPRVLAVLSSSSQVESSQSVTFSPYISFKDFAGESVTQSASVCLLPSFAAIEGPDCDLATIKQVLADNVPVTVSTLGGSSNSGLAATYSFTVPADVPVGSVFFFSYELLVGGVSVQKTFRRVEIVDSSVTKNSNPTVSQILFQENSFAGFVNEIGNFSAIATDVDAEELTVSWFVSHGKLSTSRTVGAGATEFTPPEVVPEAADFFVIAVVRDTKGGVAVLKLP